MIGLLLNRTADIERMAAQGTNGRKSLMAIYTGIACDLQPMDGRTAVENGYDLSRAHWIMFEAGQDIKRSDRVTIDGQKFIIGGVADWSTYPVVGHVRCAAQQEVS